MVILIIANWNGSKLVLAKWNLIERFLSTVFLTLKQISQISYHVLEMVWFEPFLLMATFYLMLLVTLHLHLHLYLHLNLCVALLEKRLNFRFFPSMRAPHALTSNLFNYCLWQVVIMALALINHFSETLFYYIRFHIIFTH